MILNQNYGLGMTYYDVESFSLSFIIISHFESNRKNGLRRDEVVCGVDTNWEQLFLIGRVKDERINTIRAISVSETHLPVSYRLQPKDH